MLFSKLSCVYRERVQERGKLPCVCRRLNLIVNSPVCRELRVASKLPCVCFCVNYPVCFCISKNLKFGVNYPVCTSFERNDPRRKLPCLLGIILK